MEEELTREALVQVLTLLQQATAVDMSGDVDQAVRLYGAALTRMDELVEVSTPDVADIIRRNSEEVRRKMEILRHSRWTKEQTSAFPTFPISFTPMPTPVEEFAVPQSSFARVFWLMRRLALSVQQGAYLTPHLFVSTEVWHQEGAEHVATYISAKVKYLSATCEALEPLHAITSLGDLPKTIKVLNKFVATEKELRAKLDHDMGRSKDSKSKKSVWGVFSRKPKTSTAADYDVYLTWVVNMLGQCQIFERWYIYVTQTNQLTNDLAKDMAEVRTILHHCGQQLYGGVCIFLLQDVTLLVERYNEKSRKSALKIFPVDIKLEGVE